MAEDLAETRLAPAVAEEPVAWVEEKEVEGQEQAVAEVAAAQKEAVAEVAEEEDESKQTINGGKTNGNKISHYSFVENFVDRFRYFRFRISGSCFVCGPSR